MRHDVVTGQIVIKDIPNNLNTFVFVTASDVQNGTLKSTAPYRAAIRWWSYGTAIQGYVMGFKKGLNSSSSALGRFTCSTSNVCAKKTFASLLASFGMVGLILAPPILKIA